LLHAVVGLYDTSLTELTPDVIYSTVCSKWAKTIILVRDVKGKIVTSLNHNFQTINKVYELVIQMKAMLIVYLSILT